MRQFLRVGSICVALAVAGVAIAATIAAREDPAAIAKREQIEKLIQQLDSDQYVEREAAAQELTALGSEAMPALREAVEKSKSVEVKWRARLVLMTPTRESQAIGLKLVLVKNGEFEMGSPPNEPGRKFGEAPHKVRINRPFFIGVHEVTQKQFQDVLKRNPSSYSADGTGKGDVKGLDTPNFPVEQVTWFDAIEFCNELSRRDKLRPYYELANIRREKEAIVTAEVSLVGSDGYRLPTEAEWEYACRAGTTTPWHYGGSTNGRDANVKGKTISGGYGGDIVGPNLGRTAKVGSYKPNRLGLYDMHGNVMEWCADWYGELYYDDSPRNDPPGPREGNQRVLRSGSWMVNEESARSGSRAWHTPNEIKDYIGFRVARDL